MRTVAVILSCFFLLNCVTEGDRRLNFQNFKAGTYVFENTDNPELGQAGRDIMDNSSKIGEGIGLPADTTEEYSPDVSKEAREQADKEHAEESGIISWAKSLLGGVAPWATTVVGLFGTLVGLGKKYIRKRRQLAAVYHGVENVVKEVKKVRRGRGGVDYQKLIVDVLRVNAQSRGVYKEIKEDLKKLREAAKAAKATSKV